MKFRIDSADYFSREEERGTLSLIVRRSNQILYLNPSSRAVLDTPDQWVDLDEFVDGLEIEDVPRERVRGDYETLLFRLDAYGLARLAERERVSADGCHLARLSDYAALSEFLLRNAEKGFSCAISVEAAYYQRAAVFFRLERPGRYTVLAEKDGQIEAALSVSWPNRAAGFTVLSLESAVFGADLAEDGCRAALRGMLETLAAAAKESCGKIRYTYMHERQDWLRDALTGMGFAETARFERETLSGRDVRFYDRFF